VLPILFLVGLTFAALALIMTALSESYAFFSYYTTLVMMPLMLMSGVFYPIHALPDVLQTILVALPLIHAVQLVRPLMAGLPVTDIVLHLAVLVGYGVAGYWIAMHLIRRRLHV